MVRVKFVATDPTPTQQVARRRARSAALVDVSIRLFRTRRQSGSSHCLCEQGLVGGSVLPQVSDQTFLASVQCAASKAPRDGVRIFSIRF